MAKEFAQAFYKRMKWFKCKSSYIDERILIDGGLCEICHDEPGEIVHHKILLTPDNINDPEVSLNHEYLMFVCHTCHDLFEGHGLNQGAKPLCRFDSDGHPISMRDIDISPH